ncbi:HTH-type transcriptional regulator CbbR [Clostridium pasteurianum DSM 525 = ATCC 6013]|uniref:HTH-type transcriptional regulator CbbR n=1 Tax=Clostridium pasteurianum DSM 525 = ATCC 6013 TaxID=1262449 RepID=A0A0H3J209_CLOPA|nr:LysR family transcriptional regulator [Clostridium pasteurianum]AJA47459.1 HTH-type transcriptional regulator CbbR [Clostridium pasteurianum DSM 525 = ATCC 6013]AJA51447.1 HTH-type transcriptional regulator CbbR [Clostridium pasteurianum DSM 525 = ATCC 6013]AOZ74784.1 LysR family transcriptional regulator [Clostridium pasteurianum DSM 525 = ATCC 6013]AOZ78580.1 LysR family transcriptional regulator [Clostridium pasteurianum]ELP58794.1 LysR family transcriptional regulator [Clostridium paste
MNMDLELYKIFYTVACCKNISQAAEILYISQPAVSKAIKKLENIAGITLFSRNSRGVKLTAEGNIFFTYIEKAMEEIQIGEKILSKLKKREQGIIKLGVSTTLCQYFLIPRLKEFINKYPDIQIKIINKTTFDTLKLVDEGEIDFGIISYPFDCSNYNFIELDIIQDIFVAGRDYIKEKHISNLHEILEKYNLMLLEPGNITRKYIDKYFFDNNIIVKPEIEISSMDFLIEFAKIGLGITVVIKNFIEKELQSGELVEIPVKVPIPERTIGIVSNKKIPLSIAAQTFVEFCTK